MKYCCPQCETEEEIIGGGEHYCLACRIPMIEASDYPGLWMSPALVKQRMDSTILKHGDTKTSGHGQFKREREVWTSAMFAFGLGQMNGNEYWVEIETVDATPDTRVHRIDPSSGHNRIETIDCEVVDWDEHVDDVMHVIKKKCLRAYPQSFFLLVLARNGSFSISLASAK